MKMMKSLRKQKINILLTAIIICISVVAVGVVYVPKIMKMDMFVVETGSMSPTIKPYSVIYVKRYENFSDYRIGDVVTFTDPSRQRSFTHRIVGINELNRTFTTKGDANEENDVGPTPAEYAQGKVEAVIPYLGYIVKFLRYTAVKIAVAVIYIAWAAIEIELFLAERKRAYE